MPRPTLDPESPSGKRLDGVTHNLTAELWMMAGIYDELVIQREARESVKNPRIAPLEAAGAKLTPETTAKVAEAFQAQAAGAKLPEPKPAEKKPKAKGK